MDNSNVEKFIGETNKIILENFDDFKGIYLFGSRISENWRGESDLDLMLVFDRELTWNEKKEIRNKVFEIELRYDYIVDEKIFNINQIKESKTPFRESINKDALFYGV